MRVALMTVSCLCLIVATSFGEAKEQGHRNGMDMKAMMEAYQKAAIPGAPHQQLAKLEGSWSTQTKEWMEPNKPPRETAGSCEMKTLLEGRFLQQECQGNMMGHPYSGIGTTGYDNIGKKYVSTWMDSMATGIFKMEGTASTDGKTITLVGHMMLRVGGR